MRYAEYL